MSKYSIILILALTVIDICNGYDYQKTKLRFDAEDVKLLKSSSQAKRRIVRGVFFYTYDDNLSGKQIEMHELSLGTFNKLISSKDFTKSPATIKSTFDLVSFFDGRCEASISCERIKEECTSIELHENFSEIFISYLTRLPKQDYELIRNELKIVDENTSHWTTSQIKELLKPIFKFILGGLQNTSESAIPDKIKNIVSSTMNNIDPNMGLGVRTGISNAAIIVSNNINKRGVSNVQSTESTTTSNIVNEVRSTSKTSTTTHPTTKTTKVTSTTTRSSTTRVPTTTRSSTTTKSLTTSTTTRPPINISSTASTTPKTTSHVTTNPTTKQPSTAISTSTTKPSSTTKTYIPPPASSRKPYTRWVGSYRKYSGYYSFGYSWRPFTGGNSWRTRRYSTETTTTTARYHQESLENSLNPIGNTV